MESGYLHANYAQSFAALGTPQYLPAAQGWILRRPIPGTTYADAMGCYPFFACRNWSKVSQDIADLQQQCVSLTLVTDPLANLDLADLRPAFRDLLRPYKEHFIIDLKRPQNVSAHHRRNVRQATTQLSVEPVAPSTSLDEWTQLYDHLIQRHQITGIATFSQSSFAYHPWIFGLLTAKSYPLSGQCLVGSLTGAVAS